MKVKVNFTTILFYAISVISLFIIAVSVHNSIISLMLLTIFSLSLYTGSFYLQLDNNEYKEKIMKTTFFILFLAYSVFTLTLLFTNVYFGRDEVIAKINLIPFKTIFLFLTSANEHTLPFSAILINLLGNFIAFIPLALYLPMFFKNTKKFWFYILTVTLVVICIEAMQLLLNCGSCDIDDLILNILGAAASFPIFNNKSAQKLIKKIRMF